MSRPLTQYALCIAVGCAHAAPIGLNTATSTGASPEGSRGEPTASWNADRAPDSVVGSHVASDDMRLASARALARAERDRAYSQAAVDEARGLRAARLFLSNDRERERVRTALQRRCTLLVGCDSTHAASLEEVRALLWRRAGH